MWIPIINHRDVTAVMRLDSKHLNPPEGVRRAWNPLELGLQRVVSQHVDAGNRAWVFLESSKCS